MSESSNLPPKSNLEFLRKEAKALLKRCRAGDTQTLDRMRSQLPRLKQFDNVAAAREIKLADVQHVLAREHSHSNWASLKREDSLVERFLFAVRGGSLREAQQAFTQLPEIAEESIHAACAIGDCQAVVNQLNADPGLLTAEHESWSPLFYACGSPFNRMTARHSAGILECVRVLLDRGADPNSSTLSNPSDPESRIPVARRAMLSANMPVMALLLQRGADAQAMARSTAAISPGMASAFGEYFQMPGVRERIQQRMADLKETQGQGPLWGSDKWWFHGIYARPESPGLDPGMLRLLAERGVLEPNKKGNDGLTMLHRSAQTGSVEVINLLLDNGADIHSLTSDGRTALALAVRAGKNLNVDALRSRGATDQGLRSMDKLIGACVRVDGAEIREILRADPGTLTHVSMEDRAVLVRAAALNIRDQAETMLKCGFESGDLDENGITALHVAAWHGHAEMVRLLLEHHAPVNARDVTYGSSPLGWAAHGSKNCRADDESYCAIVKALLDAGADYDSAVSRSGVKPESIASEQVALLFPS